MTSNDNRFSLKETLSAMADNEASEIELRRTLKAFDADTHDELRERWSRYQLISSALRKETPDTVGIDFSESIREAVAKEPAHDVHATSKSAAKKKSSSSFMVNLARLGVAACIAGGMVLGLQSIPSDNDIAFVDDKINLGLPLTSQTVGTSGQSVTTVQPNAGFTPDLLSTPSVNESIIGQELDRLMLEHAQNASQNTQFGILPYAKLQSAE